MSEQMYKVRAVLPEGQIGFIGDRGGLPGIRRRNGDVFFVPKHLISEKWMEVIEEPKQEKKKPGPKPKNKDIEEFQKDPVEGFEA